MMGIPHNATSILKIKNPLLIFYKNSELLLIGPKGAGNSFFVNR